MVIVLDIETPPPIISNEDLEKEEIVYFGVISRYAPRSIIRGYQPLMEYLTENTPYSFKLRLSRSYLETVDQLIDKQIDFASLGNYTYINSHRDNDIRCIAVPLNAQGNLQNYDAIIVSENSPIKSLKDLKGRTFAFASKHSFSSWMAVWMLREVDIELEDLASYVNLDHHDMVAEKVLRGTYDAGMVKAIVAQRYEAAGIHILELSPAIPGVPLVAGSSVVEEKVEYVQTALLNLKSYIDSAGISTVGWDGEVLNGFQMGHDSLYNFPRSILKDLNKGFE